MGKNLLTKGWTELMPWKQVDNKDIPSLRKGEILQIGQVIINLISKIIIKHYHIKKYKSNILVSFFYYIIKFSLKYLINWF